MSLPKYQLTRPTEYAQLEARVLLAQLASDKFLYLDIVLRDKVDRVLLLVHVTGSADCLRPGEDEVALLRSPNVEDKNMSIHLVLH